MSVAAESSAPDPWAEKQSSRERTGRRPGSTGNALSGILRFLRRLGFAALVLLAIVYLCFFGLEMARGAELGEALRHGLTAAGRYLAQLSQGELGMTLSASSGAREIPVAEVLWPTVSKSLGLLAASLAAAVLLGVPLGAWSARRRHSNASLITLIGSLAGMSLPSFFVALLLQMLMIKWVRTFGGTAPLPVGGFGWDAHIVLPALVLATRPMAQIARVTFISLSEVLDQDYVRTTYSKGLSRRSVWRRHVYRNAASPILFGEGLRRMIDRVGVGFTRVINRTTVAAGLVFVLGIQWAGHYVGPSTYYRRYASTFDGQRALALMVMGREENY